MFNQRKGDVYMKKSISKFSAIIILAFSIILMPTINSEAADGTMQISDSQAAVGEIANVTVTVETGGLEIGDCEVTLTYDTSMLEFVDGTDTTLNEDGSLFLAQYGTGTETMFTFDLQFKVLAEGDSTLTMEEFTAYLFSDERLYLEATGGTISSATVVGNPIDIDGVSYTFYDSFSDSMILDGFSKGTFDYDGYTHNVLVQNVSGRIAAYLTNDAGEQVLAVYDDSTASFQITEVTYITMDAYLLLLDNDEVQIPEGFAETTLELNGAVFTAWQNMNDTDYFLVYALSSAGNEGFYQYDSTEGTYQRYEVDTTVVESEESGSDNAFINKLNEIIDNNFTFCLAGAAIVFVVLLLIIIVMAVIIGRRNSEIDDLYAELEGENEDSETDARNRGVQNKQKFADKKDKYEDEIGFDDDEYDDNEYGYDDEYEYDDDEYEYDDDEYEYDDDEYEYDDDEYEYEDEYEEDVPVKPSSKKKRKSSVDTTEYNVDFIDL